MLTGLLIGGIVAVVAIGALIVNKNKTSDGGGTSGGSRTSSWDNTSSGTSGRRATPVKPPPPPPQIPPPDITIRVIPEYTGNGKIRVGGDYKNADFITLDYAMLDDSGNADQKSKKWREPVKLVDGKEWWYEAKNVIYGKKYRFAVRAANTKGDEKWAEVEVEGEKEEVHDTDGWPILPAYNGNGRRHENNFGAPRDGGRKHKGLDFNHAGGGDTDLGAPIIATHEGVVERIRRYNEDNDGGGTRIKITSVNKKVSTYYMHLSEVGGFKVGDKITKGQVIGKMGGSGKGKAKYYTSHLHYELIVNGTHINPVKNGKLIDPQQEYVK